MSKLVLTRDQCRAVDSIAAQELGLSGLVLMENAGLLAALALLPVLEAERLRAVILVGAGNNGGDGYALGRQLLVRGHSPMLLAFRSLGRLSTDASVQRRACEALGIEIVDCPLVEELDRALRGAGSDLLMVDAVLGTGFQPPLRADLGGWLQSAEALRAELQLPCWAIDLPSGMDADLGTGALIHAQRTLTLAASKVGLHTPEAEPWCGRVSVLPIGVPDQVLEQAARASTC
ncbi:MAG TPA: NAD(P)H-hydrate epimerase [Planctomycetes bacterium]|nr:NAD(P)H-hydrate epimerase [Planctomycetota bacterium]HIL38610.1 NAD(P)H-hydrate epimerase [Planctomycetota bacterium]